ncbi:MAG TPA: hypothetical protein VFA02_10870 [Pseudacidobacterium sp.]|nr:hypothetical protein [Pseudacidobacterium sp.]
MMTRAARWRKVTRAVLLGWTVAFLATSPFQICEVWRNSGRSLTLLVSALGYGFAVWFLLTLAGALLTWICIATPIAIFIHPQRLLRRRGLVMGLSIAAALLVVAYQLHIWTHWYHDGVGLMNFAIYALFATVFSGTAAYAYLRSLESSWTRSQASDHS